MQRELLLLYVIAGIFLILFFFTRSKRVSFLPFSGLLITSILLIKKYIFVITSPLSIYLRYSQIFAWPLGLMMALALAVIVEKVTFWVIYGVLGQRFNFSEVSHEIEDKIENINPLPGKSKKETLIEALGGVFSEGNKKRHFYYNALFNIYRIMIEKGKGKEIVNVSEEEKRGGIIDSERKSIDSLKMETGFEILRFVGYVSPIIGFMGTLYGLMNAFQKALDMNAVIRSISLCMTTSFVGAAISLISITALSLFSGLASRVYEDLENLITRITFAIHEIK